MLETTILRSILKRLTDLEAQVQALTPKTETETLKVYFYKDFEGLVYPSVQASELFEPFAIKEVTVTKGEGL